MPKKIKVFKKPLSTQVQTKTYEKIQRVSNVTKLKPAFLLRDFTENMIPEITFDPDFWRTHGKGIHPFCLTPHQLKAILSESTGVEWDGENIIYPKGKPRHIRTDVPLGYANLLVALQSFYEALS